MAAKCSNVITSIPLTDINEKQGVRAASDVEKVASSGKF